MKLAPFFCLVISACNLPMAHATRGSVLHLPEIHVGRGHSPIYYAPKIPLAPRVLDLPQPEPDPLPIA